LAPVARHFASSRFQERVIDTLATQAPANPFGPSPLRRPGSIRRTSTLDTVWPDGMGKPFLMRGHARDLYTSAGGAAPTVTAEDRMTVHAAPDRVILELNTSRFNAESQALVGCRGGGHLRREIAKVLPQDHAQTTPLNLLLDDFSGASLVAGWIWTQWNPDWIEQMRKRLAAGEIRAPGPREGVCTGFAPGSSALTPDGMRQNVVAVPPLPHPDDPEGWHELPVQQGPATRRARRIDVWLDGLIHLDVGFQDSGVAPDGRRLAIHEYHVTAAADPDTLELVQVHSEPRILPFRECPSASPNAERMLGAKLSDLRLAVLDKLPGVLGCTHLNDVLRSMADAPNLLKRLKREEAATIA
jgi:hypothetical protein